MIKYFSKAFKITNENIILTTPLVLFLFLLSIYLGIAQNIPENIISILLLVITTLFMLAAFFAGWLFMVRKAVELDKKELTDSEEKAKASFSLLKDIPSGIGEYFLPFIGAIILYTIFSLIVLIVAYKLGIHFIGKIDLDMLKIRMAMESPAAMKTLISSLSVQELTRLNLWNLLFLTVMAMISFSTMLWAPEIILRTKNPFIAFFKALLFTFKNLLTAIILFIYISFLNFTVSLLNAVSTVNPILYFVSMLIYFYFVVYVIVLVFLYYESENKSKPEYRGIDVSISDEFIKNNNPEGDCNIGTDGDGQEQSGDSDSETH